MSIVRYNKEDDTYNYNEINFLDALKDYPITKDDIKRVFHATYDKHAENF